MGRGPASGCEDPWKREAPRPQKWEWGRYPKMRATDLFLGDSEKENQSKLCKSGQKTEIRIYRLPGLALQTAPELSPPPNATQIFWDKDSPPTKQIFNFISCSDGARQPFLPFSPSLLSPSIYLFIFAVPPTPISNIISPTHRDAGCL